MSKKETMYKQCTLKSGNSVQVAWIPSEFAKQGKPIRLGKKPAPTDPNWIVEVVSEPEVSGSYLAEHERDYKTQREASDI